MGTTCKIRCKHCGAQLDLDALTHRGTAPAQAVHLGYIETEMPIRCPACLGRMNGTHEEFSRQVEAAWQWR